MKEAQASVKPRGLMTVFAEEWEAAENYFSENPDAFHCKKNKIKTKHSFIKIKNIIDGKEIIKIFALEVGEALGKGDFGKVRLAQDQDGYNFAVKIEGRNRRAENDSELEILKYLKEYHGESERRLDQPKYFLGKETQIKLYSVLDLAIGQSVTKAITEERVSGELEALRYGILCAQQLEILHNMRIVHGDVQFENFMANGKGEMLTIRDIDRGLSAIIPKNQDYIKIPRKFKSQWSPPEVKTMRSFAEDVYSLGYMLSQSLELQYDFEVKKIIDEMMQFERKDRISLTDAIAKLQIIHNEKLQNQINNRITPEELKKYVKDHFEDYFPFFSEDYQGHLELYFQTYEFKNINIHEIKEAFNIAAKVNGYDVNFKIGDEKNSIVLTEENSDKLIKTITKKYNSFEMVEKNIENGLHLIAVEVEEIEKQIASLHVTLNDAIHAHDVNKINLALHNLNKLKERNLNPLIQKIDSFKFQSSITYKGISRINKQKITEITRKKLEKLENILNPLEDGSLKNNIHQLMMLADGFIRKQKEVELKAARRQSKLFSAPKKEAENSLPVIGELSEKARAKKQIKTNIEKIVDDLKAANSITQKYHEAKTDSWSQVMLFGKAIFQSARRSPQMEAIQYIINGIAGNDALEIEDKAELLHNLAMRTHIQIKEVHPRSRLAHVMGEIAKNLENYKFLKNEKNHSVDEQQLNKKLDAYIEKIDKSHLSSYALTELNALQSQNRLYKRNG